MLTGDAGEQGAIVTATQRNVWAFRSGTSEKSFDQLKFADRNIGTVCASCQINLAR